MAHHMAYRRYFFFKTRLSIAVNLCKQRALVDFLGGVLLKCSEQTGGRSESAKSECRINTTFRQLSYERAIIIKHLPRIGLFIPCSDARYVKYVVTTTDVIHLPIAFTIINMTLFCHRTEGSREVVLRLRELSVLPPLEANWSQHLVRFLKIVVAICKAIIRKECLKVEPNVEPKGKKDNLKRRNSASITYRSERWSWNFFLANQRRGAADVFLHDVVFLFDSHSCVARSTGKVSRGKFHNLC